MDHDESVTRSHGASARLFVAVDPPPEACERLASWARVAVRGLGLRGGASSPVGVLDPQALHVTLCFLGERPVAEIDAIARALAECAVPVGELRVGAPVWLPPRRPRALAVEVHGAPTEDGLIAASGGERGESLEALHDELLGALGRACGYREEKRRFRGHITLARVRGAYTRGRARARTYGLERPLPPTPALSFTPGELILYRSWLSPEGASYEAVAKLTLVPQ